MKASKQFSFATALALLLGATAAMAQTNVDGQPIRREVPAQTSLQWDNPADHIQPSQSTVLVIGQGASAPQPLIAPRAGVVKSAQIVRVDAPLRAQAGQRVPAASGRIVAPPIQRVPVILPAAAEKAVKNP